MSQIARLLIPGRSMKNCIQDKVAIITGGSSESF